MRCFYLGLISIFLLATSSYGVDRAQLRAAGIQEMSQSAPDFTLKDPGGKEVSLKRFKGRAVLLHFWASWCKPCRDEFPQFEKVYLEFKDRDFVLLPIAIDSNATRDEIGSLAKGLGASFPVYLAAEGNVTERYWAWGVPTTYFIDKGGKIAGKAVGPRDWGSAEVRNLIDALLTENQGE